MSQSLRSKSKIKYQKSKIYIFIPRKALTRSSVGGCVRNNLVSQFLDCFPRNGFEIYKWAVELLAVFNGVGSLEIFSRALASPSGYLVSKVPEASAKNSLFREIDN